MKWPAWLSNLFSTMTKRSARRRVYHLAAATDRHTEKTWMPAVTTDADTAILPEIDRLRSRSAYEAANNPSAAGMIRTYANDCIGTGPRPQVISNVDEFNEDLESEFLIWSGDGHSLEPPSCDYHTDRVLSEMLRLAVKMLIVKGEVFVQRAYDTTTSGLQLRLIIIPPEMIATPFGIFDGIQKNGHVIKGGIEYDADGKILAYHKLNEHPGDGLIGVGSLASVPIPAQDITHLVVQDDEGQSRGRPWLAPSLLILSSLREYVQYVMGSAKFAAGISGVLESADPLSGENPRSDEEFDTVEVERNMLLTLPAGYTMNQFQPAQPTTNYPDFRKGSVGDAARPICMSRNVATADSSDHNYASGRLDNQFYHKELKIVRDWIAKRCLRPIMRSFAFEAAGLRMLRGLARLKWRRLQVTWMWPGFEHVDPQKEANATDTKLANHTTTLADWYAQEGKDWQSQLHQRAIELETIKTLEAEYGVSFNEQTQEKTNSGRPQGGGDENAIDDDDERSDRAAPRISVSA